MLTIQGKAIGRRKPLFADFSIPPPGNLNQGDSLILRDLIESIVRQEVESFQQRQHDRQFVRVLSARQIEARAEAGKIEMGGSEVEPQNVAPEQAVATALQAFEDGMYLVVIDDTEYRDLDAAVFLQPDSCLTFIRLTLLAGG